MTPVLLPVRFLPSEGTFPSVVPIPTRARDPATNLNLKSVGNSPALRLEQKVVTSHFHSLIKSRSEAKRKRDRKQQRLISDADVFRETILGKLRGICDTHQIRNCERCGREDIYRTCKSCGDVRTFKYRCSIKWCPLCNWRIVAERQAILKKWLTRIEQPKHLVTTQRNFSVLTRQAIREHTVRLAKLRRAKVFSGVRGGCVTVEITNERAGWHLHAHWLVDARWVDAGELSRAWGKLVGQDFAIVKVMDARAKINYQLELAKYVVSGSEIARWQGEEIHQFIRAVKGRRFFFTFGSLFAEAANIRREINQEKNHDTACDCGCNQFRFEDEPTAILREIRQQQRSRKH